MERIFKIEDGIVVEYKVTPNPCMEGWSILEKPSKDSSGYNDIFPIMNEALERGRFDSIKKSETYIGLGNIIFYNTKEEADEVLALENQFKRK